MSKKRFLYEPPLSMDLSQMRVDGQTHPGGPVPEGICSDGQAPSGGGCAKGPTPSGTTGDCGGGYLPDSPKCTIGSNAITGCSAGITQGV
jgi:hypothetical protein